MKDGIQHTRVKGFKLKKKENEVNIGSIKLTDDILFKGMSAEELLKVYQAAQSFSSDFDIMKYLIDDSLKYFENL